MSENENPAGSPEGRTEERWIFGGLRVSKDGKGRRLHAWIDPGEKVLLFPAGGSFATGSAYTATVTRTADGVTLHGDPVYSDQDVPRELRQDLWAADTAARAKLSHLTMERNAAKKNALDEAIQPLADIVGKIRTNPERNAVIAHILNRLLMAEPPRR